MEGIGDAVNKLWKASKHAVLQTSEIELKVLEATSNEKWGPTGAQMRDISKATYSYNDFPLVMQTIWARVSDRLPVNWRHIYKSLLLLDYLLKNGSEQIINEVKVHRSALQSLTQYTSTEGLNDVGLNVRERSRQLLELINDPERLADEREKASQNRSKFEISLSSEGPRSFMGTGQSFGDRYDDYRDMKRGAGNGAPSNRQFDGYGYNSSNNSSTLNDGSSSADQEDDWGDYKRSGSSSASSVAAAPSIKIAPFSSAASAAPSTGRPRAPSGGSVTAPTPSFSSVQQPVAAPTVDLLGLSSLQAPVATTPVDLFQAPASASSTFFSSNQQPAGFEWGNFTSSAPTPEIQTALDPTPIPTLPSSDPWKQGEKLVSLQSLSKPAPVTQEKPIFAGPPGSQYDSLKALSNPSPSSIGGYPTLGGGYPSFGNAYSSPLGGGVGSGSILASPLGGSSLLGSPLGGPAGATHFGYNPQPSILNQPIGGFAMNPSSANAFAYPPQPAVGSNIFAPMQPSTTNNFSTFGFK